MEPEFEKEIQKRILTIDKKRSKFEKVKGVRCLFLFLNREKYPQFSFKEENIKFWRIATIKSSVFEMDLKQEISFINTKAKITKKDKEIIKYFSTVLKTLNKYDKNYGKHLGLVLNRLFCRNMSLYIRDFI